MPSGVFELVCVQMEKDVNYSHVLLTAEEKAGYLAWRDSFGAIPPVESGICYCGFCFCIYLFLLFLIIHSFVCLFVCLFVSFFVCLFVRVFILHIHSLDEEDHAAAPVVNYLKERLALDALYFPASHSSTEIKQVTEKQAIKEKCEVLVKLHLNMLFSLERRNIDVKDFAVFLSDEARSPKFCQIVS
jgi:hypothetical protein